jgi:predicted small lipoprotein YifL
VFQRSFFALTAAAALLALTLVGCTATAPTASAPAAQAPVDSASQVEARAKARWAMLIKGDLVGAHSMLSPASRSTTPIAAYIAQNSKGGQYWRRADDVKAVCEADSCTVAVMLEYDLRDAVKGLKREVKETWVRDEGQWWLVYTQR